MAANPRGVWHPDVMSKRTATNVASGLADGSPKPKSGRWPAPLTTPHVRQLGDGLGLGGPVEWRVANEKLAILYRHFGRSFESRTVEDAEHVLLELARATLPGFRIIDQPPRRVGRPSMAGKRRPTDEALVEPLFRQWLGNDEMEWGRALSEAAHQADHDGTAKGLASTRRRLERLFHAKQDRHLATLEAKIERLERWRLRLEGQLSARLDGERAPSDTSSKDKKAETNFCPSVTRDV